MVAVHTLVAEILANLIDTLETAHDEALQIELGGNTHIHVLVEGIEMGNERTGRGTSGNHLQGRGLHLGIAGFVQYATQGAEHGGTLQESVLDTVVDHQIDIALTVAQFWVVEFIVCHTVLVFHDGQWLERLRQQCQFLGVYTDFARLGAEHKTLDTDEITDVQQTFEHLII